MTDPLDDVAWHALTGPQAQLAIGSPDGRVLRYADDIAPFCGVQHLDDHGWASLAAETEPGPFGPNSHRTGRWFGVRRGGRLLAMAGERMRVEGYGEVSGVCVDPSARGEGLGAVVTLAAAHGIRERGDTPMLHVRDGNDGAHRLYQRVGFEVRRPVTVAVLRWEGA